MTNLHSANGVTAGTRGPGDLPILFAPKQGDARHGISLWVNQERPRVIQPETPASKAKITNPPHMTGVMCVNGVETPVAAWIKNGKHGQFVVLTERNKRNEDGSYSNARLGTGNAVNTERPDANGHASLLSKERTPYMVFNINGQSLLAKASHGAIDYMEELGFLPEVVDNFEALLARKAAERAQAKNQAIQAPVSEPVTSRVRP